MGKLFGTDGARGIVGKELNIDVVMKIGASTARVLKKENEQLTFLIGSDTRISKDVLKNALIAGVLSENANIIDLGIIPTPAISYLIRKYNATGGFVISASHNPCEYNGIKIFNSQGYKLADELEEKIEEIVFNDFHLNENINDVGKYNYEENAKEDYVNYLCDSVDNDFSNLKIGVDVANGAAYETAKMLFNKLGIQYMMINYNPDGYNINKNAGSTSLDNLKKFVVENKLNCGVAFDGDADRCLFVDEEGNEVDGDKILAIYGKYLLDNGLLKNNAIVGTVMSNLGLVKFCENNNITFVATKVGDRYVLENMLDNDYIIGGEQSGHIIFKELANTGDGELTAIQILNIMKKKNKSLKELASIIEKYPQVLKNVKVSKDGKETFRQNNRIIEFISKYEKQLGNEGRILVRASGTENLIRIMVEGKNLDEISNICDKIVDVIEKELK
ncbi:MAG: phosphoglucosamine mutase [Clostridiales bacterium]|nr:phosphoglucosamine mutase [Clostridiales bacterium]